MVRLDAAREIDGKRKRMLTPSIIVLQLNIGDPARLFVTNKIQASIYPIHCNAILLAVGAYMSAIFAKKKGSSSGAKLPPIWRTSPGDRDCIPTHFGVAAVGGITSPINAAAPLKTFRFSGICSANTDVRYGPEADITELGCHQRLDFTSVIAGFVAPLPFHTSPLSSSKPKQLG